MERKEVGAAFVDNPRSVMILLLNGRERERERESDVGGWGKRGRAKSEEGGMYIKLSRLYEAGMEMNTPRHTRVVSPIPTSLYAIP